MTARAAVWKINHEVMESMLRMWFQQTRGTDDATDLRLVQIGTDGQTVVAVVELRESVTSIDPGVKEIVDRIVREA